MLFRSFVCGKTGSLSGISSPNSHQENISGQSDAYLVKFNSQGIRQWGTYYGGIYAEECKCVILDNEENIFLVGGTRSANNISTENSYQPNLCLGNTWEMDGFLVKFNNNGVRQWGTYYGGTNGECVESIAIDKLGNIYIAGVTLSADSIATLGSHQTRNNGGESIPIDGFLAKFDYYGRRQWSTYYGGSGDDFVNNVAVDNSNNVYICGHTTSSGNISSNNAHQRYYGNNGDGFLVKFNNNGVRQWGTYYGGSNLDKSYCLIPDINNNVFLTGHTNSNNSISTSDGLQTSKSTIEATCSDAFIVKFDSNGVRQWGTYYGGDGFVESKQISLFRNTNIFICGYSNGGNGISTENSHQPINDYSTDAFLAKFSQDSIQILSVNIDNVFFCEGDSLYIFCNTTGSYDSNNIFTAQLSDSSGSFDNPTNIGTLPSTIGGSINAIIPVGISSGNAYRIRVISSNPVIIGTDNGQNITIHNLPTAIILGDTIMCCSNNIVTYNTTVDSNYVYQWFAFGGSIIGSSINNAVNILWDTTGLGRLKIFITNILTGCKDSLERKVIVNPLPNSTISGDSTKCCVNNIELYTTTSASNINYKWSVVGGTIVNLNNQSQVNILWNSPGFGKIKIIQTNAITGCMDSLERSVIVYSPPATIINGISEVQQNSIVTYTSNLLSGVEYSWYVVNGEAVGNTHSFSFQIKWNNTGSGKVILVHTDNSSQCKNYDTLIVSIDRKSVV